MPLTARYGAQGGRANIDHVRLLSHRTGCPSNAVDDVREDEIVAHRFCHAAQSSAIFDTASSSHHNGPIGRDEGLNTSPDDYQFD